MPDLPTLNLERHLGDGVFVSFDGGRIKLRTRSLVGQNDHIIGLEREVYQALIKWVAQYPVLWEHFATIK